MPQPTKALAPRTALLTAVLAALVLFALGQFILGGGCDRRKEVRAPSPYKLEPVSPIRFQRPLDLRAAPGLPGWLFVAEQDGVVSAFKPEDTAARIWLDLKARVSRADNEEGLLGLVFHPKFAENRRAFVYFSASEPRRNVLAEVKAQPDGLAADPASLRVLREFEKPYGNHNGGSLAFGGDGKLYVGIGDGGSGGDPHDNGQNLGTWLGKILRLDVDVPGEVPADNPFVAAPGAKPEIWAYGLRNPWRIATDPLTGDIWIGDVGQNEREEIGILERGGNFGWNRYEGSRRFGTLPVTETTRYIAPVYDYGHDTGNSITGGVVYRGKALPDLAGKYVFGDFGKGAIWALERLAQGVSVTPLVDQGCAVASFGVDERNEIYIACFDGFIRRIVPQ